ncbi:MAG: hypothetical protein KF847_13260 [Pirellulales bacterium]|nr:hypothetical protein [Pirellulales bacterium]
MVSDNRVTDLASVADGLDVRAGIRASLAWGVFGGGAAAICVLIYVASERWNLYAVEGGWRYLLHDWFEHALGPVVGVVSVLVSAAWAARAPRPPLSLGATTSMVLLGTVFIWFSLQCAGLTPRPQKGPDSLVFLRLLYIVGPPILMATAITLAYVTDLKRRKIGGR